MTDIGTNRIYFSRQSMCSPTTSAAHGPNLCFKIKSSTAIVANIHIRMAVERASEVSSQKPAPNTRPPVWMRQFLCVRPFNTTNHHTQTHTRRRRCRHCCCCVGTPAEIHYISRNPTKT